MIIIYNIFFKKGQYDEVTFMAMCLIDYTMKNMIMTHDKKNKSLFLTINALTFFLNILRYY